MPLTKQNLTADFNGNLDLKTDPLQVAPQNFAAMNNSVRTVGGRMTKRFGYQNLATFSSPFITNLAVFNGGMIGIGSSVQIYSPDTGSIFNRGAFQPISLQTLPVIRNSATQSTADVAVAPNGVALVISTDSQSNCVYQIVDSQTGNVLVPLTAISGGGSPRVFILGIYFVITYLNSTTLRAISIPYASPATPGILSTLATTVYAATSTYDAFSFGGTLYYAWGSSDNTDKAFRINTLSSSLFIGTATTESTTAAPAQISVTADSSDSFIWVTYTYFVTIGTTTAVKTIAFDTSLSVAVATQTLYTTSLFSSIAVQGILSIASGGTLTAILSCNFGSNVLLIDYELAYVTCTTAPVVGSFTPIAYNLVIAGKPYLNSTNSTIYFLAFYPDTYQPTYFLIDLNGNVVGKLAYSNGGTINATIGVYSNPNINGNTITYAYLYQDLIVPVSKSNGAVVAPNGFYNQSGTNIVQFVFNESNIVSCQIAGTLQISGGFLWMYDGQRPVENNFHVWPDPISVSASGSGGAIDSANQPYWYVATYEWTDGAGNLHRSAPSIPVVMDGLTGSSSTVTVNLPSLGFTAKLAPNPVRIVVYRYSTANPVYYQVSSVNDTSGANPMIINDQSAGGALQFTDTLSDTDIVGNTILYTTGGVLEDSGGPASDIMVLFDDRVWLVDSEDKNLFWFSKEVIEATPVEMSPYLTYYVPPTVQSQESTGPITAAAAMDDKLIIFKENAIYYINGTGPDSTGANSQYSPSPIFITSAVGCSNQKSIVLTPGGLIFQTNQGLWRLNVDLSTEYIGAPVEAYNSDTVTSAVSTTGTTQVRFTLNTGTELVYDYFYQKWDTATTPTTISAVIFDGLHTLLDASGNLWQEESGSYEDGATEVDMSFTTPWYNLAGLQGFQRAYYCYLLGTYISPHKLTVQVYVDYSSTPFQTFTFNPNGQNPNGTGPSNSLEQFRIFFKKQKCQAVKFTITESFDPSFGGSPGAGLTLSGINFVLGIKKAYRPIPAVLSAG